MLERIPDSLNQPETSDDKVIEKTLRPAALEEFSGQRKIVDNLKVFIQAAKMRGEALDHVLLHGPPGLGKLPWLISLLTNYQPISKSPLAR